MTDLILVLNAGSSSLKFRVFAEKDDQLFLLLRGKIDGLETTPRFTAQDAAGREVGAKSWEDEAFGHEGAVDFLTQFLHEHRQDGHRLIAAGHRVVHGGLDYSGPVKITPEVIDRLERLAPLAPLHQPYSLEPIRLLAERMPGLTQVACFDTAFHRTQPELAQAFALPPSITEQGVRRYGFHGLSYEYIANVLPDVSAKAALGRTVVAHLGNGASMCAMLGGRSVASTMGFTAVDGLPMGTRSGTLDPGVILYLQSELKMEKAAVEELIYKESGLLGVSGLSSDMRVLLASDAPRARFAIALFIYRIGRELGSLAAAMHGIDALVFTGGIGENAALIRERVCRDAAWLGVELDEAANRANGPCITTAASKLAAWVIPTDEESMIARYARDAVEGAAS